MKQSLDRKQCFPWWFLDKQRKHNFWSLATLHLSSTLSPLNHGQVHIPWLPSQKSHLLWNWGCPLTLKVLNARFFLRSSSLCLPLAPSPSVTSVAFIWYSDSSTILSSRVWSDSNRRLSKTLRKYLDSMVFGIFSTIIEKRRLPGSNSLSRFYSRRVITVDTRISANLSSSWMFPSWSSRIFLFSSK